MSSEILASSITLTTGAATTASRLTAARRGSIKGVRMEVLSASTTLKAGGQWKIAWYLGYSADSFVDVIASVSVPSVAGSYVRSGQAVSFNATPPTWNFAHRGHEICSGNDPKVSAGVYVTYQAIGVTSSNHKIRVTHIVGRDTN